MKAKIQKPVNKGTTLREEILHSLLNSFKIEGINISETKALASLRKVELNLGK